MSYKKIGQRVVDSLEASAVGVSGSASNQQVSTVMPQITEKYDEQSEPFDNFVERLEAFFKIQKTPTEDQRAALIFTLKPNLYAMLKNSLHPQAYTDFTYEELKSKLNDLLNPKPLVILSRYKFLNRKQREGESLFDYITDLRNLIVDCQYPDEMVEMMLRDVFINGLWSKSILKRILKEDDISLEVTLSIAESIEGSASGNMPNVNFQHVLPRNQNLRKSYRPQNTLIESNEDFLSSGQSEKTISMNSKTDPPFEGSQTFTLSLVTPDGPNANEGKPKLEFVSNCAVTLEWSGNQEKTDHAILKCSQDKPSPSSFVSQFKFDFEVKLSEITCIFDTFMPTGVPRILLPTAKDVGDGYSPLTLYSEPATKHDFDGFRQYVLKIWERVHNVTRTPHEKSVLCTTEFGEVYMSDVDSLRKTQCSKDGRYRKEYKLDDVYEFKMSLPNGFLNNTNLIVKCFIGCSMFSVLLRCGFNQDTALRFAPDYNENYTICKVNAQTGESEKIPVQVHISSNSTLSITRMDEKFQISANGCVVGGSTAHNLFKYGNSPARISSIHLGCRLKQFSILYESDKVIFHTKDLIWKKITDNMDKVITCSSGVTWGIRKNGTPSVYEKKSNGEKSWLDIEDATLIDLSLSVLDVDIDEKMIALWAIGENGKLYYRHDVTPQQPSGSYWEHLETDKSMKSVSSRDLELWCCNEDGICLRRDGITTSNPLGESWHLIEPPDRSKCEKVSVAKGAIWVLDSDGNSHVRLGVTALNQGGVYWRKISSDGLRDEKFKHIHASDENVWAVTKTGILCRRVAISSENVVGEFWEYGLSGGVHHVSE